MPFRLTRAVSVLVLLALVTLVPAVLRAADKAAQILAPDGMPVRIDEARFFQDGALMSISVRNTGRDVARVTLRVFAFDDRVRFRGSASYCVGEPLQRGTRRVIAFPLDVKGASTRDRMVVTTDEVVTLQQVFRVAEPLPAAIGQARAVADLKLAALTTVVADRPVKGRDALDLPECPCSCEASMATGDAGCGEGGLDAFTCAPASGASCSAGFTCKLK